MSDPLSVCLCSCDTVGVVETDEEAVAEFDLVSQGSMLMSVSISSCVGCNVEEVLVTRM